VEVEQLRQPSIKTEHNWHNEEELITEIFGTHKLQAEEELQLSQ